MVITLFFLKITKKEPGHSRSLTTSGLLEEKWVLMFLYLARDVAINSHVVATLISQLNRLF